jgi:hypothetical protein
VGTEPIEPYREAVAPRNEICFNLVLKPIGWKARMWRAFDNSVTLMLRLDTPLACARWRTSRATTCWRGSSLRCAAW